MEERQDTTYTLQIRHPGKYAYEVTIPEIDVTTQSTVNLDSALMLAGHAIEKHLKTRLLVLVFVDAREDQPQTDREQQAADAVAHLGIAPQMPSRERHLVFALAQPLTREQARWLDEHDGKLFERYYLKDEIEVQLDALREEARTHHR